MTDSAKDAALCGNSDKLAAEITEIQSIFDSYGFPEEFLCRFDQLECLAHHRNSETYLVRSRSSGELCVAKCYSLAEYDFADPDEILSRLDRFFHLSTVTG